MSAGKASRHIHHRFFLINDKIDIREMHRWNTEKLRRYGRMAIPSLFRGQESDCLGLRLWEYWRTMMMMPRVLGPD